MLKIQKPLQTKCLRPFPAAGNSLFEKTEGNYRFFPKYIPPVELLHMTMVLPQVLLVETGGRGLTGNGQRNGQVQTELVSQLFNRLCLYISGKFTYQDIVFVTNLLRQAGVRQTGIFFRNLDRYREESGRIAELTKQYQKSGLFLRRLLKEAEQETAGENGKQQRNGRGLEYAVYDRLGTAVTAEILKAHVKVSRTVEWSRYLREWTGLTDFFKNAVILRLEEERRRAGRENGHVACGDTFYPLSPREKAGELSSQKAEEMLSAAILLFVAQRIPVDREQAGSMSWKDYSTVLYQAARPVLEQAGAGMGRKTPEGNSSTVILAQEAEQLRYVEERLWQYGEPDYGAGWQGWAEQSADLLKGLPEWKDREPVDTGQAYGVSEQPTGLKEEAQGLWKLRNLQEQMEELTHVIRQKGKEQADGTGQGEKDSPNGRRQGRRPETGSIIGYPEEQGMSLEEPQQEAALVKLMQEAFLIKPEQEAALTEPMRETALTEPEREAALIKPEQGAALTGPEQEAALIKLMQKTALIKPEQEGVGMDQIGGALLRDREERVQKNTVQDRADTEDAEQGEPEQKTAAHEMQEWRHFLDQVNERNLQIKKLVESCGDRQEAAADRIVPDRKGMQRDGLHFLEHPEAVMEAVAKREGLAGQKSSACEAALLQRDPGLYEEYQNIRRRMEQTGQTEPERQQEMMLALHTVLEEAGGKTEGRAGNRKAPTEDSREREAFLYADDQPVGKAAGRQVGVWEKIPVSESAYKSLVSGQTDGKSSRRRQDGVPGAELFYQSQTSGWEEELQEQLHRIRKTVLSQGAANGEGEKNRSGKQKPSGKSAGYSQPEIQKIQTVSGTEVSVQINRITQQVYQKLERRLQDERKRRGY